VGIADPNRTDAKGRMMRQTRTSTNRLRELREDRLMSKAELARKAGLSALTIDRVESGLSCRMDTKRKIILALGLKLEEKDKVFGARNEVDDEVEE
jgi:DNA-binding XRE family transcriptional regulator